jgi:hypothetical protein
MKSALLVKVTQLALGQARTLLRHLGVSSSSEMQVRRCGSEDLYLHSLARYVQENLTDVSWKNQLHYHPSCTALLHMPPTAQVT